MSSDFYCLLCFRGFFPPQSQRRLVTHHHHPVCCAPGVNQAVNGIVTDTLFPPAENDITRSPHVALPIALVSMDYFAHRLFFALCRPPLALSVNLKDL